MIGVRRKGKTGEQEACRLLRPWFPDVRSKRAGGETAVQDRGRDLLGTPGFCVQVKARQVLKAGAWLAEARKASADLGWNVPERPIVLWKQPRRGWFVIREYGPTWAMSPWSPELGDHLFRNGV